jgi:hypothetical protein
MVLIKVRQLVKDKDRRLEFHGDRELDDASFNIFAVDR